jgi:hypothetical protein
MKLFNYVLEIDFHARCKWSHFRIHRHGWRAGAPRYNIKDVCYRHLVWGRLSIIFGQPHLQEVPICAMCDSPDIGEVSAGDEGWTVCQDCGAIEQGYRYVTTEEFERMS